MFTKQKGCGSSFFSYLILILLFYTVARPNTFYWKNCHFILSFVLSVAPKQPFFLFLQTPISSTKNFWIAPLTNAEW